MGKGLAALVLLAPLAATAEPVVTSEPAPAQSTADLRLGVGLAARTTDASPAVRPFDSSGGVFAIAIGGDLYVGRARAIDLGFFFEYVRAPGMQTAVPDDTGFGVATVDTHYSAGEIGAVARRQLGSGFGLRGRLGMGRSRLTFDPTAVPVVGAETLPASDFRFLRLAADVDRRFEIIRLSAGLDAGRAFDLAGAPLDVMGETAGFVYGGRLGIGFSLNDTVEVQANGEALWLAAGGWGERQTRLEVALGVRL